MTREQLFAILRAGGMPMLELLLKLMKLAMDQQPLPPPPDQTIWEWIRNLEAEEAKRQKPMWPR